MKSKKIIRIASTVLLTALFMVGCTTAKTEIAESENKDVLVTLILDKGGVNDGSFNQSAWDGAQIAKQDLGVEVKYLESNTDADYQSNIETAIDMESDLIIGVGFNLSEAIGNAAKNYPEQQFAIIDGSFDEIPDNVTPVLFDEKQAGYLAGIAAAKTLTDNNRYGFVGGLEVPAVVNYKDGFEEGLKEVNPKAVLDVQYANSFTDAAKGKAIASQMINSGVECIMTAGGGVNNGVYEVCTEKGLYAVGVDMAQSNVLPQTILTSAIKKVDVGVADTINSLVNNSLEGGKNMIYNISNAGVDYEITPLLTDDTVSYIRNLKANF